MTKYKVNGGDKSERGDKVISPEAERNPLGDEREEWICMEMSDPVWEPNWVLGSQILTQGLDQRAM